MSLNTRLSTLLIISQFYTQHMHTFVWCPGFYIFLLYKFWETMLLWVFLFLCLLISSSFCSTCPRFWPLSQYPSLEVLIISIASARQTCPSLLLCVPELCPFHVQRKDRSPELELHAMSHQHWCWEWNWGPLATQRMTPTKSSLQPSWGIMLTTDCFETLLFLV